MANYRIGQKSSRVEPTTASKPLQGQFCAGGWIRQQLKATNMGMSILMKHTKKAWREHLCK